jgi:O-antigen/teichoic acid export membrane protein
LHLIIRRIKLIARKNSDIERGPEGSNDTPVDDLKGRAIRGGFVKICAQAANFILRIGSLMVLARLLGPEDFGLVGMVTAVTGVLSLFKDAGLSTVTIQRAEITNEQVSTLFWINILVGLTLGIMALAIAPVLVIFYSEPRLLWVTFALAAGFLFNAAAVQHSALLQRQLRFVALSVTEIVSLVASIAVGIGMAIADCGYWSLVGMTITLPAVLTVCVWSIAKWVPGRPRRGIGMLSMMSFGGTVTLNSLVVYIAYNAEKVLLGRFWGTDALGIYGRANQLINIPTENINSAVGGVAFSALSRIQSDPNRLKSYFLKGYSLVLALTLPICIACALFSDELIFILLGPKWQDVALIFRLLSPTVLVFALINPMWWLLISNGLIKRSLKIAFVIAPITIAAYFVGLPYGPSGVALSYSVAMILWVVPHIAWCIHGTVVSLKDIVLVVSRPFVSGIAAAAISIAMKLFFMQSLSPLPRLLLGGCALAGAYLWMLLYVMKQKEVYVDLLRHLKKNLYKDDSLQVILK